MADRTAAVWVAVGTRPEAIKMAPVVWGLRRAGVGVAVCTTGQHEALTARALGHLDIGVDEALPPVPAGTPIAGVLAHIAKTAAAALARRRPDLVLVHGDTTGALAAAWAASGAEIPIGHVEAGLRTGDPTAPWPEELNRRAIDRLATLWFAPTDRARDQLIAEAAAPERAFVTGNPVVDALHHVRDRVSHRPLSSFDALSPLADRAGPTALVTAHRRESHGDELIAICRAAARLADRGVTVVWPVHANPAVDGPVRAHLAATEGVVLTPALPYPAFVRLLLHAQIVLTDSGGVQEEAACLLRPTLVLRERTERPEVLQTGVVRLVGTDTEAIVEAAAAWLQLPPAGDPDVAPLGDGRAGERIGRLVAGWLAASWR